jgi:hypothetical protein
MKKHLLEAHFKDHKIFSQNKTSICHALLQFRKEKLGSALTILEFVIPILIYVRSTKQCNLDKQGPGITISGSVIPLLIYVHEGTPSNVTNATEILSNQILFQCCQGLRQIGPKTLKPIYNVVQSMELTISSNAQ